MTIAGERMPVSATPWYVAIGASGPQGLQDIINLLIDMPPTSNAAFMVVLHRSSEQSSQLRQVLQRQIALPIKIASDAKRLLQGVCYIGDPAEHLTLAAQGRAEMVAGQQHLYRNRTIDLLFESVATFAKRQAIGIVLSGGLDDGARGLAAIHKAGGVTMVLKPDSRIRGMQRNAMD
ncbi:chemotaxis protein CheB [Caballeronia sp. AZ7_KS35]|uniref:chemotaxis protein CheB n=1 Tax=Caballeronia sp. AZ7_KS35 TaxID=2921762 RepID=UPI002027CD36|nr:chemotaxis protein CheB [Caballeronia sp. AZ7_KS35]